MLIVVACFAAVIATSRKQSSSFDTVTEAAYRLRARLIAASVVAGIAITALTLMPWPHSAGAAEVTRRIDVKAKQWNWELSDQKVRVGEVIEFRVTSEDVNHGFALYDTNKRIVAQIQAMPGVTNKVRHRFTKPGKYEILCLEYCGLAHHGMVASIDVQPAAVQ